jgi:hypothetical protein
MVSRLGSRPPLNSDSFPAGTFGAMKLIRDAQTSVEIDARL